MKYIKSCYKIEVKAIDGLFSYFKIGESQNDCITVFS